VHGDRLALAVDLDLDLVARLVLPDGATECGRTGDLFPSTATTTSPARIPARAAGVPSVTAWT
jgi:hypothetical protein